MAIYYVHTFHAVGLSSDTKPTDVNDGMLFWELDTQKNFIYWAGQWREMKSGTGIWSPTSAEILENKTLVLDDNEVRTDSGAIGLFAFNNLGQFVFLPMGAAGKFLRTNAGATGFEFADPALGSGTWNPSASETLTNKELVLENNTIRFQTPNNGDIAIDNGTKISKLVKGANDTYLGINASGVLGYYPISSLPTGGGGGGSGETSSLPSRSGWKEGWYEGGTPGDYERAHGILHDILNIDTTNVTISHSYNDTRGRFLKVPFTVSTSKFTLRTENEPFRFRYFPYMLLKVRWTQSVNFNFFAGFVGLVGNSFNDPEDFNDMDSFVIHKTGADANFSILHCANTTNETKTPTSSVFNTDTKILEVFADYTNNRWQYRINGYPNGAWNNVTTNIPRPNQDMGLLVVEDSETDTDHDMEVYLLEARVKALVV